MSTFFELSLEEKIKTGRDYCAIVDFADLKGTAGLTKTIKVSPYVARDVLANGLFDLVVPFKGAAITSLTMKAGVNGATIDDDDNLVEAVELCEDATEILAGAGGIDGSTVDGTYGSQEAAVLASLRARAPFAAQEAGDVELVFTAVGANLTALTQGVVRFYWKHFSLPQLRGINNK